MNKDRVKIAIILLALIFISRSIVLLYGGQVSPKVQHPLSEYKQQEMIKHFQSALQSNSADGIVVELRGISLDKVKKFIEYLTQIDDFRDIRRNIILGVSSAYRTDQKSQYEIFDFISQKGAVMPILFVAAKSNYPEVIPDLLRWADQHERVDKNKMINSALNYAIKVNGYRQLEIMHQQADLLVDSRRDNLLWRAVTKNAGAEVIDYLINQGGKITQEKNGKTLLVRAVELLRSDIIRLLLQAAQKRKEIDSKKYVNTDSPLSVALRLQNTTKDKRKAIEIEELLRSYGAKQLQEDF